MPVSEYLRLFEDKRSELLEVSPPPDYQLPVAAAWNVSLDHLADAQRGRPAPAPALLLLRAGPHLPFDLLRPRRQQNRLRTHRALNDPMRLARAIRQINRYSLARIDHRTNSIEMHRLVQAVLINRMTPEEQNRMRNRPTPFWPPPTPRGPTSRQTGRATRSCTAMSSRRAPSSPTSRGCASL